MYPFSLLQNFFLKLRWGKRHRGDCREEKRKYEKTEWSQLIQKAVITQMPDFPSKDDNRQPRGIFSVWAVGIGLELDRVSSKGSPHERGKAQAPTL